MCDRVKIGVKLALLAHKWLRFLIVLVILGINFAPKDSFSQLSITSTGSAFVVDFDNTMAGVNNGTFAGTGFTASPAAGQLDSDGWEFTGMSNPTSLSYGGTQTANDASRGSSTGGVSTGGFYAFDVASSDFTLGIQPGGTDWTPGTVTLRIINNTGSVINSLDIAYDIYSLNNADRANSFNFSYSEDDASYTAIGALDYSSTAAAAGSPSWSVNNRSTTISGLTVANGAYFYMRWTGNDNGGSGSRDEFGLDNISITAPNTGSGTSIVEIGSGAEPAAISSLTDTQGESALNFDFKVTDDGATPGTDSDPLLINQIVITPGTGNDIADFSAALAGALLTDGTNTQTASIAINATDITISSIANGIGNLGYIADNANKTYTLQIWLQPALNSATIDGDNFAFSVNRGSFDVEASGSSDFEVGNGTDVESGATNNEVTVAATELGYVQQPSNTALSAAMSPAVTVQAIDENGNRDLNFGSDIRITSTGTLTGTPVDITASSGLATFGSLTHTVTGVGLTLNAERTASTDWDVTSSTFDITNITACGSEGFDAGTSAPTGWTFTSITGTYTSASNFGVASPSLKMDATNDRVETANVSNPVELSFWIKGQGTNASSALLVEGFNGGWSTIENITSSIPTSGTTYTYNSGTTPALAAGFTIFRFTYTKSVGNLSFDDVVVTCCQDPTVQASDFTFSNLDGCSMTISWTGGNGAGRVVIMNTSNSFTNPVDGTDPSANTTYGAGEQVIYNGTGSTVNIDGLTESTTYWFRVFEYECTGTDINFITPTASNNPLSSSSNTCAAPSTTASTLTFSSISNTSMHVAWTNGDGSYRLVVCRASAAVTGSPTINTNYIADQTFNNGQSILNAGEFVVYGGSGNNFTLLGLTASTTYEFVVFEFNCNSGCEKYLTSSSLVGSQTTATSAVATSLVPGNLAVLGLCSNTASCLGTSAGDDEISFVCFVDITEGTTFEMTDNGWERLNTGQWGNSEGVLRATRTGATIPAGTVITFRFTQDASGTYTSFSPDADWTITEIHGLGTDLIMNSGGDQIFFMEGGTWDYGTFGPGYNHDATITNPNILFGFNSNSVWAADGTTKHSNPFPGLECFSMMPDAGASDFLKYTGDMSDASQREWINRISTTSNWTTYTGCTEYYAATPRYQNGTTIAIIDGGFSEGLWIGTRDTNWFNCGNWQNMTVPDETVNVLFPTGTVTNECTIVAPATGFTEAESNNMTISTGRTLTIDNASSQLDIYGNLANNGTLTHTLGGVTFAGSTDQSINGGACTFYDLTINNSGATGVTLNQPVTVNNSMTLTDGYFYTDATNYITVIDNATSTGGNAGSYVIGPIKKIGNDVFVFPTGKGAKWARIGISNPSSSTTEYTAEYYNTGYGDYSIDGGSGINNVSIEEYWILGQSADDDVMVKLYWEDYAWSGINDCDGAPDDLRVTHWCATCDGGAGWWELNVDGINLTGGCPTSGTMETNATQPEYSPFTFASKSSAQNPLPVDLLNFNAVYNGETKQIDLEWTTVTESNNDFFTVEKSIDLIDYISVTSVNGAGNSNQTLFYDAIDEYPLNGLSYYRLKQTDYDGQYEYSKVISVLVVKSLVLFVRPNPAADYLEINMSGQDSKSPVSDILMDNAQIKIFSSDGQVVFNKNVSLEDLGFKINISELSRGIYNLTLLQKGEFLSVKFVKE